MDPSNDSLENKYKDVPNWVFYLERQKIELFNDLGLMDKDELSLFFAMTEFSEKYRTAFLPLQSLYKFIYEYGLRTNNNSLKVEDNIVNLLKRVYVPLHRKNYCSVVSKDNKISAIILLDPQSLSPEQVSNLVQKLKRDYAASDQETNKPFPNGDSIPKSGLSGKVLNVIPIKELNLQKMDELEKTGFITKILLPSTEIVVPSDELSKLYPRSIEKIRKFLLQSKDFSSLILLKMKQQYPNLGSISNAEDLIKTTDREPHFLIALCNEIITNTESHEREKSVNQAANFVKDIAILQSEQSQRKSHEEKSMEIILGIMKNYPVSFTKNQLLALREKHAYLKLYTERDYIDVINNFIQTYTVPESDNIPPLIISYKIGSDSRFIHHDHFFNTFFEKNRRNFLRNKENYYR